MCPTFPPGTEPLLLTRRRIPYYAGPTVALLVFSFKALSLFRCRFALSFPPFSRLLCSGVSDRLAFFFLDPGLLFTKLCDLPRFEQSLEGASGVFFTSSPLPCFFLWLSSPPFTET